MDIEQALALASQDPQCPLTLVNATVFPLFEGTINQSARVISGGEEYLVKVLANQDIIPVDRTHQFALQKSLASAGVAAMPEYLSDCRRIWIEQWLNITLASSVNPSTLELLADSFVRLHQLPVQANQLPLVDHWRQYQIHCQQPGRYEERISNLALVWDRLEKNTLCHHDLAIQHIALSPTGLIIDWEYAALSNPVFDLCCGIRANRLSLAQQHELLGHYAAKANMSNIALSAQVTEVMPLAILTEQLWSDANRVCL